VWRLSTLVLTAAAFVVRFGCGYDPHFASGVTKCAPATVAKRCPDGYMCVGDVCVTAAVTGDGGGSGAGAGGVGGQTAGAGGQSTGMGGTGGHAGAGSGGISGTGGTSGGGTGGKATGGTQGGTGGVIGTGGRAGNGAGGVGVGGMPGMGGAGGSMTGMILTYKTTTAGSHPTSITLGPDNNLWFTEAAASKIGRITTGGTITEFATITGSAGPDSIISLGGYLWFSESTNKIGKVDMNGTMLAELPIMVGRSTTVIFLAAGPDGNIWYTDTSNDNVGRMTPSGASTLFPTTAGADPLWIAPGPDGNLWFTEFIGNRISKITTGATGTAGVISRYTITSQLPVAVGPDGSGGLVFLEIDRVGRITTGGQVTAEYLMPSGVQNNQGGNIVLGPDGNFWFTDGVYSVLRMTQTGTITRFIVPGPTQAGTRAVSGMVAGPDGNLWFVDTFQNLVGRISP